MRNVSDGTQLSCNCNVQRQPHRRQHQFAALNICGRCGVSGGGGRVKGDEGRGTFNTSQAVGSRKTPKATNKQKLLSSTLESTLHHFEGAAAEQHKTRRKREGAGQAGSSLSGIDTG